MLSVHARGHHIAELFTHLGNIHHLLETNLLVLTVFSNLHVIFKGSIPSCVKQLCPCVFDVNKDNSSINAKIKNKVYTEINLWKFYFQLIVEELYQEQHLS